MGLKYLTENVFLFNDLCKTFDYRIMSTLHTMVSDSVVGGLHTT